MSEALKNYPTAGIFRRLAAMVYDSLLLMAISIGYYAIAVGLNVLIQGQPPHGQKVEWGHSSWFVFSGWLLTMIGFYVFFWIKSGQTLGMRAWRMRLISESGRLSTGQCVLRCLAGIVSLLSFGLGYFWLLLDPKKQTLHDRVSKTFVIVLPKDKN